MVSSTDESCVQKLDEMKAKVELGDCRQRVREDVPVTIPVPVSVSVPVSVHSVYREELSDI